MSNCSTANQSMSFLDDVTIMDLPLDWTNVFLEDERSQGVHTDSIPDALVLCLNALGAVDIEYMASITGYDYKTVIESLKGSIYQNPDTWGECFFKGWETADEYLSGNLMRKYKAAKEANAEYNGYFEENVQALKKLLPPELSAEDIYITLGSPWVPADVIDSFITHLFGEPQYYMTRDRFGKYVYLKNNDPIYQTIHDEYSGTWELPYKTRYKMNIAVSKTYGTDRIGALQIIEKTLNMKAVTVTDEVDSDVTSSGKKRVVNQAETVAALEKQKMLVAEFQRWVWTDAERSKRLKRIFENQYNCVKRRIYDGSFLTFPTMSPDIKLYPYQRDAVARIIFSANTLLAHDVGAGKTYALVAAGQELRRMGLSKKNMYVIPNNIVGQWRDIFLHMYPDAKLLCVEPRSFTPAKRKDVLLRMRDEEYDGILIAYSCFEQIQISKNYRLEELSDKKNKLEKLMKDNKKVSNKTRKDYDSVKKAMWNLQKDESQGEDTIYFDELGITRLFVDEAHNFKNVPIETGTNRILGINSAGSKRCKDMMTKVHMVQRRNDGKGVVFATGTPITNSVTDVFVMQQYLQSGELAMLDLQTFDGWVGMFAERVTQFEIDVDTSSYRLATRFAKFHNLPELTALLSTIADFHQVDESAGIPECDGYQDCLIAKTPRFSDYLKDIASRSEDVRNGYVSRKDDNMLKITTDGRKAALDVRLVDEEARFTEQSKVASCARNVANIYYRTMENCSTQLVFCDTSTPKNGFNLYDELKRLLLLEGIPAEKIAFVHDYDTEKQREKLFANVRAGNIRILFGSTFKLGLGVNIQDRLVALHHLDVPWKPADMTQREGRILRQGNTNQKVFIYRYITEGSFDAYSWQLLETKQRFISDLLSGSLTERSGSDIENTVLDYAEIKALAVGNPLVKERVEAANELTRYSTLQRKWLESRMRMEAELLELPGKERYQRGLIAKCSLDVDYYKTEMEKLPQPDTLDTRQKQELAEQRRFVREILNEALLSGSLEPKESLILTYRGFDVMLPANMQSDKPYVWLVRKGKYYVELGDKELGNLLRIDNYLDSLDKHLKKLKDGLREYYDREAAIRVELAKTDHYADEIAYYKQRIEELDRELGVNK